jgi:hypothetical protein
LPRGCGRIGSTGTWAADQFLGIPLSVGALLHGCSEAIPEQEMADFAVAAVEAIPVGADLASVPERWLLDLLVDDANGGRNSVRARTVPGSPPHQAVSRVVALLRRQVAGDPPTVPEWAEAGRAAPLAAGHAPMMSPQVAAATVGAAWAVCAAYAHELAPMEVAAAAMGAWAQHSDDAVGVARRAAHHQSEAFAQAAKFARDAIEADVDAGFQKHMAPLLPIAARVKSAQQAGQPADPREVAVLQQVMAFARSGREECERYLRWRAQQFVRHLAGAVQ